MIEFIGHFHPLLVHLPVGILVLALGMKIWDWYRKTDQFEKVIPFVLAFAFATSLFSALTGYVLSLSGAYDVDLLENHQWAGISLTVLSGVIFFLVFFQKFISGQKFIWILLAVFLVITGHWGGSLTHGEEYLSFQSKYERPEIENIDEALVYTDIIEPILAEKCWSCHSSKKQKGDLRMDTKEWLLKGGENGKVLIPHQAAQSHLYERLLLDKEDKEHMPPSGKPQPTKEEIKLINWWINSGSDFDQKVSQLKPEGEIKGILAGLISGANSVATADIPEKEISAADNKLILDLAEKGITILPVSQNSNYLLVNFNGKKLEDIDWGKIKKLTDNITWLNLKDVELNSEAKGIIAGMKNLCKLDLSSTNFKDEDLQSLTGLNELRSLNLVNTEIGADRLVSLKKLPKLEKIYLFETKIDNNSKNQLIKELAPIYLDFGNYNVPVLKGDTSEFTRKDLLETK